MTDVQSFLKELQFIQTWEEMAPIEEAFMKHMTLGLAGKGGSLPMIPAYLSTDAMPDGEQKVIVMDAGGTNLRVSVLKLQSGEKPEVLAHAKQPMPGHNGTITREAFFDEMAKAVAPYADQSDRIGFCFSFPCVIRSDLDGEILYMDKEISVSGIEGALVGEGLREGLRRLNAKCDHQIVILNDTVAALLGALAEHPSDCFSGFIGMILGTGTNCCYVEKNENIVKNEVLCGKQGHSIINMEAGNFNEMPITRVDRMVTEGLLDPEKNLSEKMMSGAYQGKLLSALLKCAIEAGFFSDSFQARYETIKDNIRSHDISYYMEIPSKPGKLQSLVACEQDAENLYALTDALLERAAMLAVMNLTAIMHYTGTGLNPLKPVAIAVEGTTYAKNELLRQKIRSYLISYTEKQRGYYCRVFSTEDANLVGSAVAAMTI